MDILPNIDELNAAREAQIAKHVSVVMYAVKGETCG